ncbi:Tn7-like element transposition protein TnsE [Alteromonas facilis]|uniref:Tn7-like element transposition protein TnsE n=1 Tax=Alteromonas facilis TaxID=2048004 RepID=UPI000C286995|nr:Tn7-like element transposition protein TnsE [Alteromonas facilis]
MSEVDEIGIRGIPKGSKLLLLGDWFQKPGQEWRVVCYFHNKEMGNIRRSLPIDLLPALTPGTVFPRTSTENKAQGWTETVVLPKLDRWQKTTFRDLPDTLKRSQGLASQFDNCVLYGIETDEKVYWLPIAEVARMLFFHSSEVVRAAVYQGNTWQLGKSWSQDWIGNIELSANIPLRYMNSLQYRKFFTWLLFDPDIQDSFGSIFKSINQNSIIVNGADRWTFDFTPPDLSHCEISLAGYTGRESEINQVFIREIRSVSGLKAPDLDVVYFSHPDDHLLLNTAPEDSDEKPKPPNTPPVNIRELDPDTKPNSNRKRHLVKLGRSRLHFDVELDTRRSTRQVKVLPPQTEPDLDDLQEQPPEELASLKKGSDKGKGPKADVDNLYPPDLIDAPEKIVFFQSMLQKLKEEHGWQIQSSIGDVPKKRCRSQHLVGGRPRRYCHAIVKRDRSTTIQILEIELTSKPKKDGTLDTESLSTLFFRAGDTSITFQRILDELMTAYKDEGLNAMSWKRQFISQNTSVREYLGHPDNKITSERDALDSWVTRAAEKVIGM